ncbi:MAG: hypothetical protein ACK5NY_11200, partial [Burkholderiaceae bacterium]
KPTIGRGKRRFPLVSVLGAGINRGLNRKNYAVCPSGAVRASRATDSGYGKGNKILADLFPHVQGSLPKTSMHETEYQKLKHSLIVSSSLSRFEGKLSVSELSEFSKYALSIGYNLHPSGRLKSPTEVGCVDSPLSGPVGLTLSHGQTKI